MRATVVCLLGNLLISNHEITSYDQFTDEQTIFLVLEIVNSECSSLVKTEIAIAIFKFISKYHNKLKVTALNMFKDINTTIAKLIFKSDWSDLRKVRYKKIVKLKHMFHQTFINIIYNDQDTIKNAYLQVFKSAMRLMFDSTPEISKVILLYMSTILPVIF